jgi:hypothetical protein
MKKREDLFDLNFQIFLNPHIIENILFKILIYTEVHSNILIHYQ